MNSRKKKSFNRYTALVIIMLLIFTAIASRLVYLQVVQHDFYKEKADNRSIREIPDPAPRGKIIDRNGVVLASNVQSYVLVYNETTESKNSFFSTMDKVLDILKSHGETMQDDFELKIPDAKDNSYRFEFKSDDPVVRKNLEVRFKRDRGLNEDIEKKLFKDKKDKLTDDEIEKVNEELIKISPKETFEKLVTQYKIDDVEKPKYSPEQQRRYMIIRDTVKMNSFSGYKPVIVASNISKETAFDFLQRLNELPGIDVTNQPMRKYDYGELGSAFLGYISKIRSDQEKYKEKGYDVSSDYVGTAGLEAVFEDRLKGSKGGRIVKLNKYGRIVEELGRREPYPGQNIQLTIDKDVQYAAEKALDEAMNNLRKDSSRQDVNTSNATRGAAVAIDVNTGAILALASRPGYDPNLFAAPGRLPNDLVKKYFSPDLKEFAGYQDENGNIHEGYITQHGLQNYYPGKSINEILDILFPLDKRIKNNTTLREDPYDIYPKSLYNYATSSLIPPGSTFKPLTAVAGLEEGVITPDTPIEDKGVYTKNNFGGACYMWTLYHSSHGVVNVKTALEVSCNYFFYEVGDRLLYKYGDALKGYDLLAKYAWKFGLGVDPKSKEKITSGIEIPERSFGQATNLESAKRRFSALYLNKVIDMLITERGINLNSTDSDSPEVKKLKDDIKNRIREQMKSNVNNDKFASDIIAMFKQFVSESPDLKAKNFTSSDINAITQKINAMVYDAYAEITTPSQIYGAAIGQGMNQFTPVQLANYIATLVNGGTRYKVHLVDKYIDADGNVISKVQPEVLDKIDMKPSTVSTVKQGMLAVNTGEEGTAATVFVGFPKEIVTAGKTGSATFSNSQEAFGRTSYGVYVGFAPYDKPQIAVCAVIFDGGHGGFAAPVVRSIYEAYFRDEIKKADPNYTPYYDFMKPYFEQNTTPAPNSANAVDNTSH